MELERDFREHLGQVVSPETVLFVMDGDCALCSRSARIIARFDHANRCRIVTLQSDLGQKILAQVGVDGSDPSTWVMIEKDRAYFDADAILKAVRHLGVLRYLVAPLRVLPKNWRRTIYEMIARNRYRLFGQKELCAIPSPALQERIIS